MEIKNTSNKVLHIGRFLVNPGVEGFTKNFNELEKNDIYSFEKKGMLEITLDDSVVEPQSEEPQSEEPQSEEYQFDTQSEDINVSDEPDTEFVAEDTSVESEQDTEPDTELSLVGQQEDIFANTANTANEATKSEEDLRKMTKRELQEYAYLHLDMELDMRNSKTELVTQVMEAK